MKNLFFFFLFSFFLAGCTAESREKTSSHIPTDKKTTISMEGNLAPITQNQSGEECNLLLRKACASGHWCKLLDEKDIQKGGICQKSIIAEDESSCADQGTFCQEGSNCVENGGQKVCKKILFVREGESCNAVSQFCENGFFCPSSGEKANICTKIMTVKEGEECGKEGIQCEESLFCQYENQNNESSEKMVCAKLSLPENIFSETPVLPSKTQMPTPLPQ